MIERIGGREANRVIQRCRWLHRRWRHFRQQPRRSGGVCHNTSTWLAHQRERRSPHISTTTLALYILRAHPTRPTTSPRICSCRHHNKSHYYGYRHYTICRATYAMPYVVRRLNISRIQSAAIAKTIYDMPSMNIVATRMQEVRDAALYSQLLLLLFFSPYLPSRIFCDFFFAIHICFCHATRCHVPPLRRLHATLSPPFRLLSCAATPACRHVACSSFCHTSVASCRRCYRPATHSCYDVAATTCGAWGGAVGHGPRL